jgi:hypothetical protein
VRTGGDLRHLAEQLDIGRRVIEMIVTDQATVRLATELTVFLLVNALEQRALIPGHALVFAQRLAQLLLGDVQDADLQHFVGLGVVDEIVQAAPRALDLLEALVMQDQVDLVGQLFVDLGNNRLDGADDVVGDHRRFP